MRIWSSNFVFEYPWDQVVQAAYRKYPNPYNPKVIANDVVERKVSCKKIFTKRLLTMNWNLPYLVKKIVGDCGFLHGNEQSWLDLSEKTLVLRTQNISLTNLITIEEKLTYSTDPADPNKTLLEQCAVIRVIGIPFLQGTLEDMTVRNFESTSTNGRQAIIDIIEKSNKEKL
ncbi:PRELI domain containing protein 3B-like [Dysidea avara]|uniref:PRELI domain containing protein 3B-like n=1 Tax=Dysidea avara TaxID=196820 RepID=UPI003320653B